MIRFSASLVVVALALLVTAGVTSKLLLVYVAIAVSAIALVFLIIGAILNRGELRASPPAEAPGDRLDEASPGRPDGVAARVPGDDLARRPDRLVAGARGDDPGMHGEAPMARPDAATAADPASTADLVDAKDSADTVDAKDSADPVDTKDTGDIADHTGPNDDSSPGDTENVRDIEDTGGTGGVEDLADTRSADQPVTVVPGVPRYHRSDCILIRFMGGSDLQKMPVEAARKNGCTPCRACHTDGEETG